MGWWEERAQLEGKVALLTGGAGGLGEASTLDLSENGVNVAVIDIDPDACARLSERLPDAIVQVGDARDPEQLEQLFVAVDEKWGRLDILVNVVGGTFSAPFEETSPNAWDALLRTNLMHIFHATSLAIPRIKAGGQGGSIINFTTIEAYRAAPSFAVYSAAKGAVVQFTKTLSVELAPDAIRVNNVAPDMTPTAGMMGIGNLQEGVSFIDPVNASISLPMGRLGDPTDVSGAVVFLASELSSYITGTSLHPDGGTFASSGWFNWPDEGFRNTVPDQVIEGLNSRGGK